MDTSGGTKCSRTSQSDQNEDDDELESDDQESEKKPTIRPYVRSKLPRLRWTPELHLRFVHAVERLGGHDRATPKMVLQLLDIKGLNIAHVKSHLQMYRSKKIDDPTKGIFYQNYLGGGNQKMYNLDRLPGLQGFSYSRGLSTFRYGDHVSYNNLTSWAHKPYMDRNSSFDDDQRSWLHKTFEERLIRNHISMNNCNSSKGIAHFADALKSSETTPIELDPLTESRPKEDPNSSTTVRLPCEFEITRSTFRDGISLKRKEASNSSIDLNLSLGLKSRVEEGNTGKEDGEEMVDGNLSLSLFSNSGNKLRRMKEGEYARRASTLDLTI